jgi:hypothetical protein
MYVSLRNMHLFLFVCAYMDLRKDNLVFKLKANKRCVGPSERRLCREKNKPQNSDKRKFVLSEDATFHTFKILNRHKFSF